MIEIIECLHPTVTKKESDIAITLVKQLFREIKKQAGTFSKIPASEIEKLVKTEITDFLRNKDTIQSYITEFDLHTQKSILSKLTKLELTTIIIRSILSKATIYKDRVEILLCRDNLIKALKCISICSEILFDAKSEVENIIEISAKVRISNTSRNGSVLIINSKKLETQINPFLVKIIAKSYYWNKLIEEGKAKSSVDIQKLENVKENTYIKDALSLRILSPKIVESIFNGTQPPDLTVQKLLKVKTLDWSEQEQELNFAEEDTEKICFLGEIEFFRIRPQKGEMQ